MLGGASNLIFTFPPNLLSNFCSVPPSPTSRFMADTNTGCLCTEIIHTHFGPLTAVSLFCISGNDSNNLLESCFDPSHSGKTSVSPDRHCDWPPTTDGSSISHRSHSTQCRVACAERSRARNVRDKCRRVPYETAIREISSAGGTVVREGCKYYVHWSLMPLTLSVGSRHCTDHHGSRKATPTRYLLDTGD